MTVACGCDCIVVMMVRGCDCTVVTVVCGCDGGVWL